MIGPFGKSPKVSHHARAVVTGAGSGIGAAFAIELARRGSRVVCSDIDEVAAKRTVERDRRHRRRGGRNHLRRDPTRRGCRSGHAVAVLVRRRAHAGDQQRRRRRRRRARSARLPIDDWQWVLGINLWGPSTAATCSRRSCAQPTLGRPRGIINVASAAAFGAAPGMAAYNVSKAGVLSLSETLAAELVRHRRQSHRAVPDVRQDQHRRIRPHLGRVDQLADRLMRWTGVSPERVARTCLDTHDRGGLYCMPQPDARIGWGIKRFTPRCLHPRRRPGVRVATARDESDPKEDPMAIDMDAMLAKIKDRQWALADIDWDAPGAETITDEQRPKLKAFMADLCWIENIGARGFAALAKKAPTPTHRRDLPLLPRRGAAPRQRRTGADEALGHARGRRDARAQREHPAGHRLAGPLRRRHAAVAARHRHPDARGRAGRRAAEVPARRGARPGVPPGVREDQQRRIPAICRRFRGARHDRARRRSAGC